MHYVPVVIVFVATMAETTKIIGNMWEEGERLAKGESLKDLLITGGLCLMKCERINKFIFLNIQVGTFRRPSFAS